MKKTLRSTTSTAGRRMAGARSLWRANGMRDEQFGRPIVAIANSFTQLVPGHVHLHEVGQMVKARIERHGMFAAEFNTIAIDDGIAMGHEGMLYSLPSRELIADSVEYMCNAHQVDALICISNCDKITPGMMMATMRLNIPTILISGGPMEAGRVGEKRYDLIDAMVRAADPYAEDSDVEEIERAACPTCGSCSGMFTANSMNCLNEALGLALPGNGTVVATHSMRTRLFEQAADRIVELAGAYYEDGDESILPRSIGRREAFLNAMSLDIAMGGSTNTVLHLLAVAHEAGVEFTMTDIDYLSRSIPCLCKVAPNSSYHIEDVNRAGGILAIMGELDRLGKLDTSVRRVDGLSLGEAIARYDLRRRGRSQRGAEPSPAAGAEAAPAGGNADVPDPSELYGAAPAGVSGNLTLGSQSTRYDKLDLDRASGCIRDGTHAYAPDGGLAVLSGNLAPHGCIVKTAGVAPEVMHFSGTARVFHCQESACQAILEGSIRKGDVVVIAYEGPKGGPGMQEMLYPTSYIKAMGLGTECALITDGRFSGGTSGLSIGHVSPEAAAGGEIALVRDGDRIEIHIPERRIELAVSQTELRERHRTEESRGKAAFTPERSRAVSTALRAYAALASSADHGAVRWVE